MMQSECPQPSCQAQLRQVNQAGAAGGSTGAGVAIIPMSYAVPARFECADGHVSHRYGDEDLRLGLG
jgi:hypothetical protein